MRKDANQRSTDDEVLFHQGIIDRWCFLSPFSDVVARDHNSGFLRSDENPCHWYRSSSSSELKLRRLKCLYANPGCHFYDKDGRILQRLHNQHQALAHPESKHVSLSIQQFKSSLFCCLFIERERCITSI